MNFNTSIVPVKASHEIPMSHQMLEIFQQIEQLEVNSMQGLRVEVAGGEKEVSKFRRQVIIYFSRRGYEKKLGAKLATTVDSSGMPVLYLRKYLQHDLDAQVSAVRSTQAAIRRNNRAMRNALQNLIALLDENQQLIGGVE